MINKLIVNCDYICLKATGTPGKLVLSKGSKQLVSAVLKKKKKNKTLMKYENLIRATD